MQKLLEQVLAHLCVTTIEIGKFALRQSKSNQIYRAFHGFWQGKFTDGGLVLGLSQFLILPQLPPKIMLDSKLVKIDPKIIISPS